jgi:membrane protease YdiL (CAAX protease family)
MIPSVQRSRQGLAIYFSILIPGSALLEWLLLRTGDPIEKHHGLVFGLMWIPALASLVARILLGEGIRDVSFRFGGVKGAKTILVAWIYPLAVAGPAYGLAWAAGLADFSPPLLEPFNLQLAPPLTRFGVLLALSFSFVAVFGTLFAAGEEIGWRGYMLTRLIDGKIPRPVLASGLVWGIWHLPLILSGQYASGLYPALSAGIFVLNITGFAYLAARLRLESGSVWPATFMHAAWNAIIQDVFDASTQGKSVWVGESGILVTLVNLIVVAMLVRGSWMMKREPGETEPAVIRALAV